MSGLRGRRKFGARPTLDAMSSSQDASPVAGGALSSSTGQNPFARGGDNEAPQVSAVQLVPPGVNPASSVQLVASNSAGNVNKSSVQQLGIGLRQSAVQDAKVERSYVVSDSGNQLTLGPNLHIGNRGVREFDSVNVSRAHQVPVGGHLAAGVGGGSVSSIRASLGSTSHYRLGFTAREGGGGPVAGAGDSAGGIKCRHVDELDFDHGTQIGRGSSGKVYNVLHTPSSLRVCVKQMEIEESRHREEIKRELQALHKESSRFIVDFYGAFFHNDLGVILLVLELMEGSVHEVIKKMKVLTEQQTRAFALQVVHGLKVLHHDRHLIHRDIKPANLLFHRSGQVKITDFGVSRAQVGSMDPTTVMTFVGSISYMSPERLNNSAYGYHCDIWSLGVLLCEAVTKYHPFQEFGDGPNPQPPNFWGLLQEVMKLQNQATECTTEEEAWRFKHPLWHLLHRVPDNLRTNCNINGGKGPEAEIKVSAAMDDFVAKCLAFDKKDRASADELLNHPWLTGTGDPADGPVVSEPMTLTQSETIVQGIATEIALMRQSEQEQERKLMQELQGGDAADDQLCPEDEPLQTSSGTESNVFFLAQQSSQQKPSPQPASAPSQAVNQTDEEKGSALLAELLNM